MRWQTLRHGVTGYQLASYGFTIVMLPINVIAFFPLYTPYCSIAIVVIYVYVYCIVIYLTFRDSCLEELMDKTRYENFVRQPFNQEGGRHVIENMYCNICCLYVEKETKHCKRCNYCVKKFDHHCVWLNNCIGSVNYKMFVLLVASICFSSLLSICMCGMSILNWFSDQSLNYILHFDLATSNETFRYIWLLCCVLCVMVYVVSFSTTAHLLWFHIKLLKAGMTTYKFIVSKGRAKVAVMQVSQTQTEPNPYEVVNTANPV